MSADEAIFSELQQALVLGDLSKVQHVFSTNNLGPDDASKALSDQYRPSKLDISVLQYLLEKGADPKVFSIRFVRSLERFKILAKHGYDISSQGHLVLQYVFGQNHAIRRPTDHV